MDMIEHTKGFGKLASRVATSNTQRKHVKVTMPTINAMKDCEAKKCPQCGINNDDSAKFCGICGARL